jgi:hypothetical protein
MKYDDIVPGVRRTLCPARRNVLQKTKFFWAIPRDHYKIKIPPEVAHSAIYPPKSLPSTPTLTAPESPLQSSLEEVFVVDSDLGKMECRVRPDVAPVKLEVGNLRFLVLAPL